MSKRLIYIAPGKSTFVLQDIDYLSHDLLVTPYFFKTKSKSMVPFEMVKLFWALLLSKNATFLVSFGGYHSFVATLVSKLRGNKCYIILNGTDCASIPEFGYGHLRGGLLRWSCLTSYRWATKLLPVSHSLLETTNTYAFDPPKRLGLKTAFDTGVVEVIHNGFDADFWKSVSVKEPNTFITVSGNSGLELKGIDLFLELAKARPDGKFRIAGMTNLKNVPSNVEVLGFLSKEELRVQFSKSQYYFQLSIWEGFGCALCEAMLCECIPIVSDVNILPQIVGEPALVLKKRNLEMLKEVVLNNTLNPHSPNYFRRRIEDLFPLTGRLDLIMKQLNR